ncbi:hypothetical protein, partial [Neobacillus vireti]|uniref:hypothetical protein n=1 Tax=Neobacillus vireti TaxID=220686 RepID=UPI002FFDAA73
MKLNKKQLNKALKKFIAKMITRINNDIPVTKYQYQKFRELVEAGAKCKISNELVEAIFSHKFTRSCEASKDYRCGGEKAGYENVKYQLGDKKTAFNRLKEKRPGLYKDGIKIVKVYLEESFKNCKMAYQLAPVIHRRNDTGHYSWGNIQILPRNQHDELAMQKQTLVNFSKDGFEVELIKSMRALSQTLGISAETIKKHQGEIVTLNNGDKITWHKEMKVKMTKPLFKRKIAKYKELVDFYETRTGFD